MLLESNATLVRRFEFIGFTDFFAIYYYESVWTVIEDLEQKPLLIIACDSLRRGDTVDTAGGIRAVRTVEALHFDTAVCIIEEHASVSIDDRFNPRLEFERSLKFFLSYRRAVITLSGERVSLDLPIRVSIQAEFVHTGCEQINPFLLAW